MKYLLHWRLYPTSKEVAPSLFESDMTSLGYVLDREIDIDPPCNIYDMTIAAAVTELRREQGQHTAAITEIDRKIQELLCIEHKQGE